MWSRRAHARLPPFMPGTRGAAMIYVEEASASAHDQAALEALLLGVPHPPTVRKLLKKRFFGRRWDRSNHSDYWLSSNGERVVCVTIRGAAPDVIAVVRSRLDAVRAEQTGFVLSKAAVCALLKIVLGPEHLAP